MEVWLLKAKKIFASILAELAKNVLEFVRNFK